jgi:hypothetical protein
MHIRTSMRPAAALLLLGCLLAFQAPAQADEAKDQAKMASLMKRAGYDFEKKADGVWVVVRQGKALSSFKEIVALEKGLVVIFVIVAHKADLEMDLDLATRMLAMNHEFDRVKIGTDDDGDAFVRLDASLRVLDVAETKEDMEQVASAADEVYGDIEPNLNH